MLYGHVHDSHDETLVRQFVDMTQSTRIVDREGNPQTLSCNMINCFCMYSDYTPLSLDEWLALHREQEKRKAL